VLCCVVLCCAHHGILGGRVGRASGSADFPRQGADAHDLEERGTERERERERETETAQEFSVNIIDQCYRYVSDLPSSRD
jgi:hypothetical protein